VSGARVGNDRRSRALWKSYAHRGAGNSAELWL